MNNNGTLLSHLLNIVLWQFSNVKKVSKKYMLLNRCKIFYGNCFRLNCSQIIRWGGMGNAISYRLFPWWGWTWGRLPLHWPGRGPRSGILACHLWMSRSNDSSGRWHEGISLVIPHQHPVKFRGIQVQALLLLGAVGVQDGTIFCFSCFPHKTNLFGYVFAHSWIK